MCFLNSVAFDPLIISTHILEIYILQPLKGIFTIFSVASMFQLRKMSEFLNYLGRVWILYF